MVHRIEQLQPELDAHTHARRALDLVRERYQDQGLSRERAAKALRISVSQLDRQLREAAETTFFQLLCWYRVWVATQEQQRDRPGVAELADRVGFTSEGTCTRAYKKHLGMTPGQYRKHLIAARKQANQVADPPEPRLGAGAAATEEDS